MFDFDRSELINTNFHNIFLGVVEDNNDPEGMGRCRVRILGIHTELKEKNATEGIPTDELPWALAINPIAGGSVSGMGIQGVPVNGSWVCGFFLGGDHNNPAIFGSISGYAKTAADTTKGFNDPNGVYPTLLNQPDWNTKARNKPDNYILGFGNITIELDNTAGEEKINIEHANGSTIVLDQEGNINITSTGKATVKADTLIDLQVGETVLDGTDGIVTGKSICHFTGSQHSDVSSKVKCSKV